MQHQVMRGMRGYAFSLSSPTPSFGRVGSGIVSLSAIDARTWTLLRSTLRSAALCRLLALDDEDSAIGGLTPSRSLRKASRPPRQLELLRRPQ
jgi:hypothetical protein